MHQDDLAACLVISENVFGANYHHPIYFELTNKNHHYFVVEENNQIIGFSILYKISKNQLKKITANHFQLNYDFYFLIDVIAVSKNQQQKGAGTSLLNQVLRVANNNYPLYSVAWKNVHGVNIEKLYKNNNINPMVNLGKIWVHGCNHKFQCPSFDKHCQCEGLLFKFNSC